MKIYKQFLISIVLSCIAIFLVYSGYTIYAEDKNTFWDCNSTDDFTELFSCYHESMNDFFNNKIETLNELVKKPEFFKDPKFNTPVNIDPLKDDTDKIVNACDGNVSSYCVSIEALQIYIAYVQLLDGVKATLVNDSSDLNTIFSDTKVRNDAIDKEFNDAKEVMEATVAAYNQYRLAYPMHKKYQQLITELTKYKLLLKDIRQKVARFPGKFHDATSSQCQ